MKSAFLFPGQGSQKAGMLHDLPQHTSILKTLLEANEVLNQDVLLWDTEEALQSTVAVQVTLLTAEVATARALMSEGATPDMVAGHSVGSFSAAVIAGVLNFKDALLLVKKRGELMESAYPHGYGMGVVLGLNERTLLPIIEEISTSTHPVFLANVNAPDQITIAGMLSAIENVFEIARRKGARKAHFLNVSVPSHCALLQFVSDALEKAFEDISFHEPRIPYAGNRTARALRKASAIREDLALSISNPVRWYDATSVLFELGARLYVEMSPGSVLTELARSAFTDARSLSVSEYGLQTASILIQREKARSV
ncbi:malonate decarboxylase epsilon subunit [Bacillus sp. OV194]|nr:malonate decarboxylase epsilon subunit [Bacillus sp. OV194]